VAFTFCGNGTSIGCFITHPVRYSRGAMSPLFEQPHTFFVFNQVPAAQTKVNLYRLDKSVLPDFFYKLPQGLRRFEQIVSLHQIPLRCQND